MEMGADRHFCHTECFHIPERTMCVPAGVDSLDLLPKNPIGLPYLDNPASRAVNDVLNLVWVPGPPIHLKVHLTLQTMFAWLLTVVNCICYAACHLASISICAVTRVACPCHLVCGLTRHIATVG
jgi:hypothetical protein